MAESNKRLATASGKPYVEHENTMSVGPRGPLLLQDYILHKKMAHFSVNASPRASSTRKVPAPAARLTSQ